MKTIVDIYETWVKTVEVNIPDDLMNKCTETSNLEIIDFIESISPDDEIEINFEFSHINDFTVFHEDGSILLKKEY